MLAAAAALGWQGDYAATCREAAEAAVSGFYERWNTDAKSFTSSVSQANLRYQGLPSTIQGPEVAAHLREEIRSGVRHRLVKTWHADDGLVVAFVELDRVREILGIHEKGLDVFRITFDKSSETCAATIRTITFGDPV